MSIGCPYLATAAAQAAASGFPSTPAPIRSSDGLALLQHVLTALGDANGLHAGQSCVIETTVAINEHVPISIDWTLEPNNYITVIHGTNGDVSVGSRAPYTLAGKTYSPSERLNRATFIVAAAPLWLGRALNDPRFFVSDTSNDQIDGQSVIKLQLADVSTPAIAKDSLQIWYFDSTTLLPLRVEYKIPSTTQAGLGGDSYALFSGFTKYPAGLFPTEVFTYQYAKLSSQTTLSSAICSPALHSKEYFTVHGKRVQ